jgi:outer membrane biosynthesis protein TonB
VPKVSLEAQLLRFRLVTPDQMSEAMRAEAESGRPVAEIVVERGWVSEDDLARVLAPDDESALHPAPVAAPPSPQLDAQPPAAPEPTPEPELPPAAAAPPPQPEPLPEPPRAEPPAPAPPRAEAPAGTTRVVVRLHNGDRLEAGSFGDAASARQRAKELVTQVQAEDSWPFVAGRAVSPEEIETIFLERG